ncbi:MAG: acylneuraminate cytidylyltransferase family protein [Anaerolineaceae bacterium]|nr:acylneuraminate cytidylyltransferase family protein [Anaerolineaceae bacterium]
MSNKKIVALVPMRHESVRVPQKNYRMMAGKPLFHHILNTLLSCPEIGQVVVDTDSPIIQEGVRKYFPQVLCFERPEELRADTIPTNEILMYDIANVDADLYLQTHCTNPLLKSETISKAIQEFKQNFPAYDSMFGVTRMQTRLWDQFGKPVNHDPAILLRTQDLPPIYEENSCLYLFTRETIIQKRNRIGERPMMFEISRDEALDIDEEIDFTITQLIMLEKLGRNKKSQ